MAIVRTVLYALMEIPVTLAVRIFFRRLEVVGREHVPAGPVVVAANHPNMLLDPLLVGMVLPGRRIRFLAKAPLFGIPVVGTLFRILGVLPVYRKQDAPEKMGENQGMFATSVAALHEGDSIGIFPEGVSADDPRLQPLKTGAARILLEAAATAPPGRTPKFLPCGLNYGDRVTFRSDVLVVFGAPIDPTPYLDRFATDPQGAAKVLTEALESALEAVLRNLDRAEDEAVVQRLERVYRTELAFGGEALEDRFHLSRSIVEGYEHFRRSDPARVARVERLLELYHGGLDAHGYSGAHLRSQGYRTSEVLRFLARLLPLTLVAAPLALWGIVMNFVPYNLVDPIARRGGAGREEIATRKVLWGAALFAVFYLVQTLVVAASWGGQAALLYLVALPGTGFVGLWWLDRMRYLSKHARTFLAFAMRRGFRESMDTVRRELLSELQKLAEEYLKRLSARAPGGAG